MRYAITAALVFVLAACGVPSAPPPTDTPWTPAPDTATLATPYPTYAQPVPGPWSEEYEVLGHGQALVTYVIGQGFNEQQQTVTLPWTLPMQDADAPRNPILSAQLHGNGTVTCNIHQWYYDISSKSGVGTDKIISTATSSGAYVIASCTPPP